MSDANQTPPAAPPPPPVQPVDYATPPGAGLLDMEPNPDARLWGMLCHLAALGGHIVPFGHVVGPLVVWLIKKDVYPFVDDQGKESLNFQITMTIAMLISGALICLVIGIFMLIAVFIANLIFIIIAAVQANSGKRYRYPFAIRLIT